MRAAGGDQAPLDACPRRPRALADVVPGAHAECADHAVERGLDGGPGLAGDPRRFGPVVVAEQVVDGVPALDLVGEDVAPVRFRRRPVQEDLPRADADDGERGGARRRCCAGVGEHGLRPLAVTHEVPRTDAVRAPRSLERVRDSERECGVLAGPLGERPVADHLLVLGAEEPLELVADDGAAVLGRCAPRDRECLVADVPHREVRDRAGGTGRDGRGRLRPRAGAGIIDGAHAVPVALARRQRAIPMRLEGAEEGNIAPLLAVLATLELVAGDGVAIVGGNGPAHGERGGSRDQDGELRRVLLRCGGLGTVVVLRRCRSCHREPREHGEDYPRNEPARAAHAALIRCHPTREVVIAVTLALRITGHAGCICEPKGSMMTDPPLPQSHRAPVLIAHRTAMGLCPENTIVGIEAAIASGVDGVEIDVRATRDGVLVLMHDASLERTTGDPRDVEAVTLDELRALRVLDPHGDVGPQPVPTFAEALQATAATHLVIEVKQTGIEELVRASGPRRGRARPMLAVRVRRRCVRGLGRGDARGARLAPRRAEPGGGRGAGAGRRPRAGGREPALLDGR